MNIAPKLAKKLSAITFPKQISNFGSTVTVSICYNQRRVWDTGNRSPSADVSAVCIPLDLFYLATALHWPRAAVWRVQCVTTSAQ